MTSKLRHQTDAAERVAIIGAGVSGIAAGNVWKKCGYAVTIFEASHTIGGQWTNTYPGVRLQNTAPQYQFADYPWPFEPDRHPTSEQVYRYIEMAARTFALDIRTNHRVTRMEECDEGWVLTLNDEGEPEFFSYVVIATGLYPYGQGKWIPPFKTLEHFKGEVVTKIDSDSVFDEKRVVVVGFGKTALDYVTKSASRAAQTVHVFRTPRWTLPDYLLGIDFTLPLFARFGSDMMPSWVYSSTFQVILHSHLGIIVGAFWWLIASLFRYQHERDAKLGNKSSGVLDAVIPPKSQIISDMRSATAVAPSDYYHHVAHRRIIAQQANVEAFDEEGVVLSTGDYIEADLVCFCVGNETPTYPYLPKRYRAFLEHKTGGPALYRHLIHPKIPRLGFAGYNHGFLHLALCEMGALWNVAAFRGDLQLPSPDEMTASAERVSRWKQANSSFESSYNLGVNARYQQYLDTLLKDLGISQWRKLPNIGAELFLRYDPTDYRGVVSDYQRLTQKCNSEKLTYRMVQAVDA